MGRIADSYHRERLCLGKVLPLDTPLSVILDASERCNFRCCYCFRSGKRDETWGYAGDNGLMSMEVFKKAAGQLSDFPGKVKNVSLSGHGEPLCHPQIGDMARYLRERAGIDRVEMHTNASLLTKERAEDIAAAGFTRIVVSLQGLDAAAYRRVCGAEIRWETFYDCLGVLYSRKKEELELHIKISEAAFTDGSREEEEERFYRLFRPISDTVSVEKVTPLWRNMSLNASGEENKYGQRRKVTCCPILFYKMWVAPDGAIYPCTGLPAPMCLGNIEELTLREAWDGRERAAFLREHLKREGRSSACAGCFVPVNTVTCDADWIDPYREEILARLEAKSGEAPPVP